MHCGALGQPSPDRHQNGTGGLTLRPREGGKPLPWAIMGSGRGARAWARRLVQRRTALSQATWLTVLAGTSIAIGLLAHLVGPDAVPPELVLVPILAGGVVLEVRPMRRLLLICALVLGYAAWAVGIRDLRPLSLLGVAVTAVFAVQLTQIRERLGISGARSETLLLELRDRLRRHGELPALPPGWQAEVALRAAGGTGFGGDFLVAARSADGTRLEVALVDVSGKGVDVAGRALLLSGALGGLLGAVRPDRFLRAANDYLFRQGWEDGFATAAYLAIDVATGHYTLYSAGHPPAAHFDAGSGRWGLSPARGPVLGVVPDAVFEPDDGLLHQHDALVLYTDGLVEVPGADLGVGIDRLLGQAERLVPFGFTGGAERLVAAVAPRSADDRAVVLVWRS